MPSFGTLCVINYLIITIACTFHTPVRFLMPNFGRAKKTLGCGQNAAAKSDAADRLQPGARMEFSLREHRGLRPEALDQRADEWPDCGGGHQHRRLALAGSLLKAVADRGHQ